MKSNQLKIQTSYDTRTLSIPSHWSDTKAMGNRTFFRMGRRDSGELIIKQVEVIKSYPILYILLNVCHVLETGSTYSALVWVTGTDTDTDTSSRSLLVVSGIFGVYLPSIKLIIVNDVVNIESSSDRNGCACEF